MILLICDLLAITVILTGLGKQSNGVKRPSPLGLAVLLGRGSQKWGRTLKSHKTQVHTTDPTVPRKEKFLEFVSFLT